MSAEENQNMEGQPEQMEVPPETPLVNRSIPNYAPIEVPPAPEKVATLEADGPRLMITQIVNENFKSYAGIQKLGPFHKSFSSIVGPNGSGKSNVIDSMLFVFGYRANKLRLKKISYLIHNSEDHKNVQSCTVSVHFQKIRDTGTGENDFEVVQNSKFVVSRTAFKDNSSYYKINDSKATYKEVAKLLRGHGIDLDHNRFLILQGEVEQIAMMKAKAQTENDEGMLEFLEDIIGSNRFKEPLEILSKRVEELNELRSEKINRVRAIEKEKNDLEGSKDEAVEYLTMDNEIVRLKNKLYQKYISECKEIGEKAVEKRDAVAESMKEVSEKMTKIQDNKKEKGKEQKAIFKKYEKLSASCDQLKEQFSECEQKDVQYRDDLKHSKAKMNKLNKTLEQEKTKLGELKQIPEKMEDDIQELEKKREKLGKELEREEEKLKEVMESLKTETQGLQKEKEGKEEELLGLQKGVNDAKSKLNVAQTELDLYMSNLQSEENKLRKAQQNLERITATLADRRKGLNEIEKRLPETEKAMEKALKDLEEASEAETRIQEEVRQGRHKVESAKSSLSAARSSGKVLDSLMELKRNGRLPGIAGRLGNLGAIDEKYDVAISTACGSLDHIVVDTIGTAQKCVEFLRMNNIGVATFIALDKMQKWNEHCARKITTPENVPRLFDLVKVTDKSILPAFYFALRDTLVAKDLDQATRIAYGKTRFRVVTLSGQLIDQSGTMSGGGKQVCKGRMGSNIVSDIDPKELQQLEAKLQQDSLEIQKCRDTKHKLESTLERLKRTVMELKHGINKFSMDIKGLEEQEVALKEQVKEQKEKVKAAAPDEKTLKQLEKTVNEYKKEHEKAAAVASKVEEQVDKLRKQIMDIGGSKLKAAESKVNMVQAQMDQITGHITKAKVNIKTAKRNTKKTEDKIESIEEEIKETTENLKKTETGLKDLEEEATKVLKAYQQAQAEMKEVEAAVNEIREQVAALEEEEQTLQKDHIEVKHQLEKYESVVKENQQKVKHWERERGKLSLTKIELSDSEELEVIEAEALAEVDTEKTAYEITVLEEKLAQMTPNMAAIAEYRKKEEQYLKRVSELDQITDLRDKQRQSHEDLRIQRLNEFMTGFSIITDKLKEMYQMITLGGDAELELVDSLDPFSEGIVFSVRPPKKSWKNISSLSGGEKTLSSLALVFALHHYKPTPLYVMDEIDAALDFKNVSIVANYIKERTKNAQFIIISLRNNMFELADRLIGIYKTFNCTKSVTINPQKLVLPIPQEGQKV